MNFGPLPEAGGRSRLEARFHGRAGHIPVLAERVGDPLSAAEAAELGLVTGSVAAAEWEPTIRRAIEERAGARFGDRAGLAFALPGAGPQTLEGKIFAGCARWTSRRR
jgi:enoyl-CoA hydratase/carnithine racemase